MLRIASYYGDIQSCGRNDGSPLYYTNKLRELFGKEKVEHIMPAGDFSKFGEFDYHFLVDFGEDALGYQDFELPHPSIYITSDTHLGYDYRLSRAKRCDWVFCCQEKARGDFIRDGVPEDRCFWLPHAFDPLAYSPGVFNIEKNVWDEEAVPIKRYDVCFIGNLNDDNRVDHLDRLFKAVPKFYWGTQRFHEAASKFNESKIVFNVSSRGELNMRHSEALGSGAFLLSDNIDPTQNIYKEGVHFAGYSSMDEMVDKARYYLAHDEEREKIAQAGHLEAITKNTYLHRLIKVLDTVGIDYDPGRALELLPKVLQEAA